MDKKYENQINSSQSFEDYLNSDEFIRQLAVDHSFRRDVEKSHDEVDNSSDFFKTPSRPRLSNKSMLRGLVERTECFNKSVNKRVMTDSRLKLEEDKPDSDVLEVSKQNIPVRGRGDCFGKLRSVNTGNERFPGSTTADHSFNNSTPVKTTPLKTFARTEKFVPVPHQFDPSTAYNGRVEPGYRFNYKPEAVELSSPNRPGALYPKRPENCSQMQTKQLTHNYYNIVLYGTAQSERNAQRIEKTVRQTETPPRF